jgi:hypothetical protein
MKQADVYAMPSDILLFGRLCHQLILATPGQNKYLGMEV